MEPSRNSRLKVLPAIGELLSHPRLHVSPERPRWALLEAARAVVEKARVALLAGSTALPDRALLVAEIEALSLELARPRLHRVINATGVIVHTNLGRAPLSERAIARVVEVARGYSNLEYDLERGARGTRHGIVEDVLCRLTGAEAAMVVNNNAAAVLLALSALAAGREVIVSRGELVEIGGSFRIPDILRQSGCRLIEVGTTNRTRLSDYADAITLETGLLLKVHPSNFRIVGFTEEVSGRELANLGRARGIPVVEDLGRGCLIDLTADGLTGEPTGGERISSGLDLVTMSGDKLLGGPQAGILIGRTPLIAACRAHPLARAVRIDKLCLAALEGTLASYLSEDARAEIPVLERIARPLASLERDALALQREIAVAAPGLQVTVEADGSRVGGGAYPERDLPTRVVVVRRRGGVRGLELFLRQQLPPIIARQRDDALVFDPRTLLVGDEALLVGAISRFAAWDGREGDHGPTV